MLRKHKHISVFSLMYSSASSMLQLWAKLLSAPILCTQMSETRPMAGELCPSVRLSVGIPSALESAHVLEFRHDRSAIFRENATGFMPYFL